MSTTLEVETGERIDQLEKLARLIRYYILTSTTQAGSGHPTSSLSAVELMTGLCFGGCLRFDVDHPDKAINDRIIFSKGHASPLLYSLWAAAGQLSEEGLMTYRHFGSPLQGHPTPEFPLVDAATGSLGQGLSIGVGMALDAKYLDALPSRIYVLLGDSEMAEGSQWEAIQLASHYRLDNLVGILDVNRLGQRGETMLGYDLETYQRRVGSFGWETVLLDGHDLSAVLEAFRRVQSLDGSPLMLIAKTVKGKGVSFVENQNGFHGKALNEKDLERALEELGEVDRSIRGTISLPEGKEPVHPQVETIAGPEYALGDSIPTRNAYGNALNRIFPAFPQMVALDGEVSNSTRSAYFKKEHPEQFFEMYIAEQNMAGAALGLACRGKIPFASTFSAFWSRAFDQIRMSQHSAANIKFVGSHAGVSIGMDGPSQMGLEDIAMFRSLFNSVVLYPCDAVSTERLVEEAARSKGIAYLRTTRMGTPVIYDNHEEFPIGGSKVLRSSSQDVATVVAAGVTLHQALEAYERLREEGLQIRVVDLYSVKPIDLETLRKAARETRFLLTVEDHHAEGGIGEAVRSALSAEGARVYSLAVTRMPKSGQPERLLAFEEINADAIVTKVNRLAGGK